MKNNHFIEAKSGIFRIAHFHKTYDNLVLDFILLQKTKFHINLHLLTFLSYLK